MKQYYPIHYDGEVGYVNVEVADGLRDERDRLRELLRRAAELFEYERRKELVPEHYSIWREKREQWLKDAGVDTKRQEDERRKAFEEHGGKLYPSEDKK